jgi:HlyD family secretion protein
VRARRGSLPNATELARHLDDPDVKDTLGSERKLFELRRQGRLGQKKQLQERTAPARPIQFP